MCTDCGGTYFRKDNKGCITNCNYDLENADAKVNYNLNSVKKCIQYCKSYGAILKIVGDDYNCVTSCTPNTEYLEDTANEKYCRICSFKKHDYPEMVNCTECTGPLACTKCDASSETKWLKSDKKGC